jgi:aspartate racemase
MMKRIGMIGGIGWPSTVEYYRLLNEGAGKKIGTEHSANLILVNLDAGEIRELAANGDEDTIFEMVLAATKDLKSGGAELLVLCANGVHRFYEKLNAEFLLPIVHIADATAKKVQMSGLKKVALLGIMKTMEDTFYQNRLSKFGIQTLVPSRIEREYIDQTIYDEMVRGQFLDGTREKYINILNTLIDEGAEGIILGCTELPLLIKQIDITVPLFSTIEIHCLAAIEAALTVKDSE